MSPVVRSGLRVTAFTVVAGLVLLLAIPAVASSYWTQVLMLARGLSLDDVYGKL